MARGLGFVGFGLLNLLLLGGFWYAGAAPAKFDVKEHIATSTRRKNERTKKTRVSE